MKRTGARSLTFRLTLLFASASSAVLLTLGFLITGLLERHFEQQDVEMLTGVLHRVRDFAERGGPRVGVDPLARQLDESLLGQQGVAVALHTADGNVVLAGSRPDFMPNVPDWIWHATLHQPYTWTEGPRQFRAFPGLLRASPGASAPLVAAVVTDISEHSRFMANFAYGLWVFVAAAAVLTGLLGWFAARRGLAPLTAMKQGAAAVTASGLSYRLPVGSIPSELAELAESLNEMLSRLEDSFRRLSDFSSDIAHELRTPVSTLLTQTQVALSKARAPEDYQQVLLSNGEELERLARMVSDMLFLARSDQGLAFLDCEDVHLCEEVKSLFEFYEALAEEKQIRLVLEGSASAHCDRGMLRRAMSNLLSNAIRHTHAGAAVAVRIEQRTQEVTVTVENEGDGIPPEHLPRLFDRFYRIDPSRRAGEGTGLGLAITRAIVRAHGGEILARSEGRKTLFVVHLPHISVRRHAHSWLPTPITRW